MGHVDHGKTTLLDFIRKTNVTARETGGITQHIGAYQVKVPIEGRDELITFIDTPGHEAYSAMRARGGKIADIAVLVVAADDGVMPQTKEAVAHIKAARIPMIVAINKIDLPDSNADRVKKGLSEAEVLVEGYGGDVVTVPISAKTGQGVPELLEMILLTAELAELKSEPGGAPEGVVIESKIDRHRGVVATIIIKKGTLRVGQEVVVGGVKGKVRQMTGGFGDQVKEAGPGTPVEILGLETVPAVGTGIGEEAAAITAAVQAVPTLEELQEKKPDQINLIIKADVAGSLEAIAGSLQKLAQGETKIQIIHSATGEVNDSDVNLAQATGSLVLSFRVKVADSVKRLAESQRVNILSYDIIYKLLEDMEAALAGLTLDDHPIPAGTAEIIATFPHDKTLIFGVKVKQGSIARDQPAKILRGEEEVASGRIKSIRHLKEEVPKAETGKEYGLFLDLADGNYEAVAVGDTIQSFPKG
jgi:translation initiation factor IF-2